MGFCAPIYCNPIYFPDHFHCFPCTTFTLVGSQRKWRMQTKWTITFWLRMSPNVAFDIYLLCKSIRVPAATDTNNITFFWRHFIQYSLFLSASAYLYYISILSISSAIPQNIHRFGVRQKRRRQMCMLFHVQYLSLSICVTIFLHSPYTVQKIYVFCCFFRENCCDNIHWSDHVQHTEKCYTSSHVSFMQYSRLFS